LNSKRIKAGTDSEKPAFQGLQQGPELPHVVHPAAVYTVDDLRRIFGLKASSVRREVRMKRLRIAKRCGRYYCLGQWLLEWFEDGELKPQPGPREATANRVEQNG
jgi:hypothetical protein